MPNLAQTPQINLVVAQRVVSSEALVADRTRVRPVSRVTPTVRCQTTAGRESLLTDVTFERFLSTVRL